ncbi:MAG TPA: ubiquitin-like small modifier protein 1 [Candidatus Binataceae bacterium]|jgi:molybdopterin synthase sulfur carrier subunit|nr:ubiquitin-like small modifier protein 1 [Candidatus Binataceae bacterium]
MPVRVRVPTPLRRFTAGNGEVAALGASIKEVINDLESRHPGMRDRLLDDKGEIRRFVNIYLNGDDVRFLDQLNSAVKDGDDISIVPAIAGGR